MHIDPLLLYGFEFLPNRKGIKMRWNERLFLIFWSSFFLPLIVQNNEILISLKKYFIMGRGNKPIEKSTVKKISEKL